MLRWGWAGPFPAREAGLRRWPVLGPHRSVFTPRLMLFSASRPASSVMKSLLALFLLCLTAVLHAQTVTSLNTTSGSTAGGTSVTLTGTGFTGATGVSFGGVNAASFTVVNDTTITATTGAGSAGSARNSGGSPERPRGSPAQHAPVAAPVSVCAPAGA